MKPLHTMALLGAALGVVLPMPRASEPVSKDMTQADLDRIEAAKRKRERKAQKRK